MKSPEQMPESEATKPVIIGPDSHIVLDESVKTIDFSMSPELLELWPDDLSTSFEVSKGRIFWRLTEISEDKSEDELAVLRHRRNKEINTTTFIEADMLRSEKEKKVAIAAGAFTAALATIGGAATAYLIVHKRKSQ